jgi:hypothetical protein
VVIYRIAYSEEVKSHAKGCIPLLRITTDRMTEIISHTSMAPAIPAIA